MRRSSGRASCTGLWRIWPSGPGPQRIDAVRIPRYGGGVPLLSRTLERRAPVYSGRHSQGAYDLLELLKREFREPALQKKLIAAYLIGCPVTDADLAEAPHLKTAEGPLDFGVIVSWNTEAPEAAPSLFTGRPGTRCINPLNWRTDAVEAPASANIGAVFFDGENRVTGEIPGFCSAKVEPVTGALVAVPQFPGQYDSPILGAGIYHMNDIYFFYRNIEVNARDRAANYFNSNERAEGWNGFKSDSATGPTKS